MGSEIEDKLASILHNLKGLSTTVLTNPYQYWTICLQLLHISLIFPRAHSAVHQKIKCSSLGRIFILENCVVKHIYNKLGTFKEIYGGYKFHAQCIHLYAL